MNKVEKTDYPLDAFYTKIYRRYDLINRLFTLGQDERWRACTAKKCLSENPSRVLDLCCGTADLALRIKKMSGAATLKITGYDFNAKMLDLARDKSTAAGYNDLEFIQGDAAAMPFDNAQFDAITIGFGFRNLSYKNTKVEKHLSEMSRVLTAGGKLYILESGVPNNPVIRFFYKAYLNLVLIPLGSLLSGDAKAYAYLARSSANFFNRKEIEDLLSKHGFGDFEIKSFLFGATNLFCARKLDSK